MKHKNTIKTTICCALLLNLIALSAPQIISRNIASATVGQAVFCPNNYQPTADQDGELELANLTCIYIVDMLDNRGPNCYYSCNTTVSTYRTILAILNNYFEDNVVFSKGHRGLPYNVSHGNTNHISLLDNIGDDLIDHSDIFSRTSSENYITFIWHCETAEKYQTGTILQDNFGPYGMPYCWTHNQWLYCWGNSGNQVFLGWADTLQKQGSPQFLDPAEGAFNYAHVAYYFWYYMCDGDSVEDALDHTAQTIFGDANYLASPLKDWLVVWGDRTVELP